MSIMNSKLLKSMSENNTNSNLTDMEITLLACIAKNNDYSIKSSIENGFFVLVIPFDTETITTFTIPDTYYNLFKDIRLESQWYITPSQYNKHFGAITFGKQDNMLILQEYLNKPST